MMIYVKTFVKMNLDTKYTRPKRLDISNSGRVQIWCRINYEDCKMKRKLFVLALLPMLLCSCNVYDKYAGRKFQAQQGNKDGFIIFDENYMYTYWSRKMYPIGWIKENVRHLQNDTEASAKLGDDFEYKKEYVSVYWIPPRTTTAALEFCGFFIDEDTFFTLSFNATEYGTRFSA